MKTGTKVAIAVGSATAAGVILYLILRPSPASAPAAATLAPASNPAPPLHFQPQPRATYSKVLDADAAFQLKVGDTIHLEPAPLSGMMQTWTAQNCPHCVWKTNLTGTPVFQFGQSTASVVGDSNPVIQPVGDGTFKAVGSGTGTIDFVYADPSGNPVGARYHVDVTVV